MGSTISAQKKTKILHTVLDHFYKFSNQTSIHGLKFIAEKTAPLISKFLWICITALAVIFCVILTDIVWLKFRKTPSIVVIETTNYPIYNIPYPGITLCNSNLVYRPAVETFIQNMSRLGINESSVTKFVRNLPLLLKPEKVPLEDVQIIQKKITSMGLTIKDLMQELMQPCEKMLVRCGWRSEIFNCTERFHVVRSVYGHCCSFNYHGGRQDEYQYESASEENVSENDDDDDELRVSGTGLESALSVIIDCEPQHYTASLFPFYGVTVLVHDATDYPETSMVTSLLQPGKALSAALSAIYIESEENIRSLKLNIRKCWFDDEMSQNSTDEYSYQTCITECRMDTMNELCGCVPYYYPFTGVKFRTCDLTDVKCMDKHSRIFSGIQPEKGTKGFTENSTNGLRCDCLPQCTDEYYSLNSRTVEMSPKLFKYSPAMRGYSSPNLSVVHVFFSDLNCVKYRRYSFMTWDELFAAFGGVFGLCLGGSAISMIELVYYFTIRLWTELRRKLSVKNNPSETTFKNMYQQSTLITFKKKDTTNTSRKNKFNILSVRSF